MPRGLGDHTLELYDYYFDSAAYVTTADFKLRPGHYMEPHYKWDLRDYTAMSDAERAAFYLASEPLTSGKVQVDLAGAWVRIQACAAPDTNYTMFFGGVSSGWKNLGTLATDSTGCGVWEGTPWTLSGEEMPLYGRFALNSGSGTQFITDLVHLSLLDI